MTRRERGDGKLSLFIFLALLAAAIFVLVKWIPPRVNAYEFRDEITKWNTDPDYRMRRTSAEEVEKELLKRASDLNLPIDKDNITVERDSDMYRITVVFDIPIDLKVKTIIQHYEFREPK